ncbi:MAG: hypothetical protein K2X90_01290 [Candidatus Babeliaceae bacterium]|nr:hypothetical protein [Candidatus Babeliaceae bacterium]
MEKSREADRKSKYRTKCYQEFCKIKNPEAFQKILKETGVDQQDLQHAFRLYAINCSGKLPITKERIIQLAERYREILAYDQKRKEKSRAAPKRATSNEIQEPDVGKTSRPQTDKMSVPYLLN